MYCILLNIVGPRFKISENLGTFVNYEISQYFLWIRKYKILVFTRLLNTIGPRFKIFENLSTFANYEISQFFFIDYKILNISIYFQHR